MMRNKGIDAVGGGVTTQTLWALTYHKKRSSSWELTGYDNQRYYTDKKTDSLKKASSQSACKNYQFKATYYDRTL